MKMMKKITTLILTIALFVACFSMSVFAADGKIMFTDPQTKTGETVEITGVVQTDSGKFGKIEITMKYDTTMLKFKSGDGVSESDAGIITYKGDATNDTGARKEFKFSFTALKEGTTKIEITKSEVQNVSNVKLNYTEGSSTVTIAKGEDVDTGTTTTTTTTTTSNPSDGNATVEVNGVDYTISNEFPEDAIPEGYEAAELEYDLVTYKAVYSEEFGMYLVYLVNEENAGDFFMYVDADATFAPYEEIKVSESVKIALLSDASEVMLPEEYKATSVVLNEHEFPAWQLDDANGFCVLYAINNLGDKALYQLDNTEGTYQRFIAPEVNEEFPEGSFIATLKDLLENHLDYVILGTGLGFLIFILIIIVLSVKLYNRNAELDEIYDEYGIDGDEKDDIVLDLDEDEDEVDDEFDEGEELAEKLIEESVHSIQEDIQEIQELKVENSKDVTREIKLEIEETPEKASKDEESLGSILKEIVTENDEEEEDFDDILENFSVDFIDLDD